MLSRLVGQSAGRSMHFASPLPSPFYMLIAALRSWQGTALATPRLLRLRSCAGTCFFLLPPCIARLNTNSSCPVPVLVPVLVLACACARLADPASRSPDLSSNFAHIYFAHRYSYRTQLQ